MKTKLYCGMTARRILCCCVAVLSLSGCLRPEETEDPNRPKIAYDSPVRDTAGASVYYAVISTGGAVTSYSITPSLPGSLHLDPLTGVISGTMAMMDPTNFSVTATGPGGTRTATIRFEPRQSSTIPPKISYGAMIDTMSRPFSHLPLSTGGVVTSYSIEPFLPFGITLNASTGEISGTPLALQAVTSYQILALGPAGADTATLSLSVVPYVPRVRVTLEKTLRLQGAPAHVPPNQTNAIRLAKLILHIFNEDDGSTDIRDTILAGSAGFSSTAYAQVVTLPTHTFTAVETFKSNWRAEMSILDVKGREVYSSRAVASCPADQCILGFGDPSTGLKFPRGIYSLAFQLPDLIQIADGSAKQTIRFERFVASINGAIVVDSLAPLHFAPNATAYLTHFITWEVKTSGLNGGVIHSRPVELSAYGRIGAGASELLFEGTVSVPSPIYFDGRPAASGGKILGALSWVGSLPYSGTLPIAMGPLGSL